MKNNGFTLIELLAVIVILAIIALIATSTIIGLIDDARKESFKSSAYGIVKAGELLCSKELLNGTNEEVTFTYTNGVETSSIIEKKLEYNGSKPKSGNVVITKKGQVAIAIHNGKYCVEKGYSDSEVTISDKTEEECKITSSFVCGNDLVDARDGEKYKTVKIGEQCWMAENLRYTEGCLENGSDITWTSGKNNACYIIKEGDQGTADYPRAIGEVLYQWKAAMNWDGETPSNPEDLEGTQGVCPDGWYIPSGDSADVNNDWNILANNLGGISVAGSKLRSISPDWNGSEIDNSGFNALPIGYRMGDGIFVIYGSSGGWWTSSVSDSNAWYYFLNSTDSQVFFYERTQANGDSVRCLLRQ